MGNIMASGIYVLRISKRGATTPLYPSYWNVTVQSWLSTKRDSWM